ncbi:DUF2188 domain-containing protein [Sporosarcina koreensis]|uniref:DUF2188 domain-containing protein n=1 Tax=Sporosarcina koreensis TaxID=334735 RepID=UPI00058DF60A|nr:DUF2188 domain-containing protein [Sporosarcina koreensis]
MNKEQEKYFEDRAGTEDARYHIVPHGDEWAVKREGEDDAVCTTGSQDEAIDEAKKLAKETGTMVYIHNEHGRIEKQLEFNKDKNR